MPSRGFSHHCWSSSSGNLPTRYSSLRRSQSRSPTSLRSRRSRQIHSLRSLQTQRSLYNRRLHIPHNHRSTSSAATTAATATAAAATAAAATTSDELHAGSDCSAIFFVKDIERRQADVRDFLFGQNEFVAQVGASGGYVRRRSSRPGAHQRERQTGSPQRR
jgi:hypothetical protein